MVKGSRSFHLGSLRLSRPGGLTISAALCKKMSGTFFKANTVELQIDKWQKLRSLGSFISRSNVLRSATRLATLLGDTAWRLWTGLATCPQGCLISSTRGSNWRCPRRAKASTPSRPLPPSFSMTPLNQSFAATDKPWTYHSSASGLRLHPEHGLTHIVVRALVSLCSAFLLVYAPS